MMRRYFLLCLCMLAAAPACAGRIAPSPDAAAAGSPFGVCVDLDECKNERFVLFIKKAGIRWVRQPIRWDLVEPQSGEFHWSDLDRVVDNEHKNGLGVCGLLHWMSWSDPTTGDEEAMNNWINFVSLVVQRYKDTIRCWEVWNEEDYEGFWKPPSAARYVRLLRATALTARRIDPGCTVVLGGLMGWGGKSPYFPFLDEVYKNGGKPYFDIVAFHPYTFAQSPRKDNLLKAKIDDVLQRMNDNGDTGKPIWITEIGWPSNKASDARSERAVTPAQQASYLTEALEICLSYPQIKKVFWYCLRDAGGDPVESEHHYGLLQRNCSAKPSYGAYRDFIKRWKQ